jgi:hypothetical protein
MNILMMEICGTSLLCISAGSSFWHKERKQRSYSNEAWRRLVFVVAGTRIEKQEENIAYQGLES